MDIEEIKESLNKQIHSFEEISTSEELYEKLSKQADEIFYLDDLIPEIISKIREKKSQIPVLNSLVFVMLESKVDYLTAVSFFSKLFYAFDEISLNPLLDGDDKLFVASGIEWYEERFWKSFLYGQINEFDLARKYEIIQAKLSILTTDVQMLRVYKKALVKIEAALNSEIRIKTEAIKNREILQETKTKKTPHSSFTNRQKVIALLYLTFNRLDLPEHITKERIVEFFQGITGIDTQTLRDLLAKPTNAKESKKSKKVLCDDLNMIRDQIAKIGIDNHLDSIKNEIQLIIDELEEEN
jgi:hypothetical protein